MRMLLRYFSRSKTDMSKLIALLLSFYLMVQTIQPKCPEFLPKSSPYRAWVGNPKQRVPITNKSSNFNGETQHYTVKLPKSAGARQCCPEIPWVPGTLGTGANSSPALCRNFIKWIWWKCSIHILRGPWTRHVLWRKPERNGICSLFKGQNQSFWSTRIMPPVVLIYGKLKIVFRITVVQWIFQRLFFIGK